MLLYTARRVLMMLAVLLILSIFMSSLVHILPGEPARIMLGPRASPEYVERVREEMYLDYPVHVQIGYHIWDLLNGSFGTDVFTGRSINQMIADNLPHTIMLTITSVGLAMLFGFPLGVLSATYPNTWLDRLTSLISISLITMPSYVVGLFLLLIFAVGLRVMPAMGLGETGNLVDYLKHLVLPATALALSLVGYLARLIRSSMLEVLNEDYIRFAKSLGLTVRLIYYKYALKNALIPTVAMVGVIIGLLLGGAVFVEVIFTRPGMGTLIYRAIESRNYPIVRSGVLVVAFLFVLVNTMADLVYTYLDPRIQLDKEMRG